MHKKWLESSSLIRPLQHRTETVPNIGFHLSRGLPEWTNNVQSFRKRYAVATYFKKKHVLTQLVT
jgi:hypothetical protein